MKANLPGKRARTRQLLLDATVEVIARKGIAALRVTDVTEQAGVANGTFYNYFDDTHQVIESVAVIVAARMAKEIDAVMRDERDAVVRVVRATARAIDGAVKDPGFGAVMVESLERMPEFRSEVLGFMRQDLDLGVKQGVFDLAVTPFALEQMMGLLVTSVRSQLIAGRDMSRTRATCENVLRLCGLSPSAAREAVDRNLPHQRGVEATVPDTPPSSGVP
jgi:AcrR family transcriptional regulator